MRSFKQKVMDTVIIWIVMLAAVAGVETASSYYLQPVSFADYANHDLAQLKSSGEQVDLIFLGASKTMCSEIPSIFCETLGLQNTFNACTSGQQIESSYYLLKDLSQSFDLKYAVLGIDWGRLTGTGYTEAGVQARLVAGDHLLSPLLRAEYAVRCFSPSDYLYQLPSYRFRSNLNFAKPKNIIRKRQTLVANGYQDLSNTLTPYGENGFIRYLSSIEPGSITVLPRSPTHAVLNPKRVAYLGKIVQLCKENDIQLFLISSPTTMAHVLAYLDWDESNAYFSDYAQSNNLTYLNLNFLVGRETFLPDSLMKDGNHVNEQGAQVISQMHAEIMKKQLAGEDVSSYFYPNLAALKADVHRIVSVNLKVLAEQPTPDELLMDVICYKGDDLQAEYRVLVKQSEDAAYTTVCDWSEALQLSMPLTKDVSDTCTVRIEARTVGSNAGYEAYGEYAYADLVQGKEAAVED